MDMTLIFLFRSGNMNDIYVVTVNSHGNITV